MMFSAYATVFLQKDKNISFRKYIVYRFTICANFAKIRLIDTYIYYFYYYSRICITFFGLFDLYFGSDKIIRISCCAYIIL